MEEHFSVNKIKKEFKKASEVMNPKYTITITDSGEVSIDGSQNVLEYDENTLRLLAEDTIIKLSGNNLLIRSFTAFGVIVTGEVLSVEFEKQ